MMCTADGPGCALTAAPGGGFASVADALRVGRALGAYLNSPAARDLVSRWKSRKFTVEAVEAVVSSLPWRLMTQTICAEHSKAMRSFRIFSHW